MAVIARNRYPTAFVGWFWYVGTLVPVIGAVQVGAQSMADRYTYVPAVGIFILITWSTAELVRRLRLPRAITFAGATVVLGVLFDTCRSAIEVSAQ